jgi:hypothetical protein
MDSEFEISDLNFEFEVRPIGNPSPTHRESVESSAKYSERIYSGERLGVSPPCLSRFFCGLEQRSSCLSRESEALHGGLTSNRSLFLKT